MKNSPGYTWSVNYLGDISDTMATSATMLYREKKGVIGEFQFLVLLSAHFERLICLPYAIFFKGGQDLIRLTITLIMTLYVEQSRLHRVS